MAPFCGAQIQLSIPFGIYRKYIQLGNEEFADNSQSLLGFIMNEIIVQPHEHLLTLNPFWDLSPLLHVSNL